jgi:DNA-binding NarL/FixJ family response regulator
MAAATRGRRGPACISGYTQGLRLPGGDGVSLCREIRSVLPGTARLMLTGYSDDQALMGAIMAGAAGEDPSFPRTAPDTPDA